MQSATAIGSDPKETSVQIPHNLVGMHGSETGIQTLLTLISPYVGSSAVTMGHLLTPAARRELFLCLQKEQVLEKFTGDGTHKLQVILHPHRSKDVLSTLKSPEIATKYPTVPKTMVTFEKFMSALKVKGIEVTRGITVRLVPPDGSTSACWHQDGVKTIQPGWTGVRFLSMLTEHGTLFTQNSKAEKDTVVALQSPVPGSNWMDWKLGNAEGQAGKPDVLTGW